MAGERKLNLKSEKGSKVGGTIASSEPTVDPRPFISSPLYIHNWEDKSV
jgi:hypothetical protein